MSNSPDRDRASVELKGRVSPVEYAEKEKAIDFGGDSTLPPPPVLTAAEEKALYRKIDLRLMPILSLMYLCSFLDRGICPLSARLA